MPLGPLPYKYTITAVTSVSLGNNLTVQITDKDGVVKGTAIVFIDDLKNANIIRVRVNEAVVAQMEVDAGSRTGFLSTLLSTYSGNTLSGGSSDSFGGGVPSVFGRTGSVLAAPNDYSWGDIAGKPSTFPPSVHSHTESEVTNLVSDLAAKAATAHTHPESEITNLVSDLAGKQAALGFTAENSANKNAASGYAGLSGGKVAVAQMTAVLASTDLTNNAALAKIIANGTATFATTAIASLACSATVTVAATNTLTTDVIIVAYATAPVAATDSRLNLNQWVTANNVSFNRCNTTAASITPTALILNWKVLR